jgi:hypothetical protein
MGQRRPNDVLLPRLGKEPYPFNRERNSEGRMISTNKFRWLQRTPDLEIFGGGNGRVLQQWWVEPFDAWKDLEKLYDDPKGEWRDVPIEIENEAP